MGAGLIFSLRWVFRFPLTVSTVHALNAVDKIAFVLTTRPGAAPGFALSAVTVMGWIWSAWCQEMMLVMPLAKWPRPLLYLPCRRRFLCPPGKKPHRSKSGHCA